MTVDARNVRTDWWENTSRFVFGVVSETNVTLYSRMELRELSDVMPSLPHRHHVCSSPIYCQSRSIIKYSLVVNQ